jgi:hypothetical protein
VYVNLFYGLKVACVWSGDWGVDRCLAKNETCSEQFRALEKLRGWKTVVGRWSTWNVKYIIFS